MFGHVTLAACCGLLVHTGALWCMPGQGSRRLVTRAADPTQVFADARKFTEFAAMGAEAVTHCEGIEPRRYLSAIAHAAVGAETLGNTR